MALIGEIRKHSGLLVGTIAVSIVGFLVMDATNSQTGFFNSKSDNIGYVNGNKITYRDFNNAYDKTVKMVEDQRGRGASITELERDQIKEQTWNDFINTGITEKITDNLGLTVSDDELIDLTVGNHPHQMILQNFSNPQTGQFDANAVKMFIQNVDIDEKGQEPGTKRKMWTNFLDGLKKMQFNEKYNTLVAKGLNTPSWMAEKTFVDENKTADFKYVAFPHSEINDADLKITDAELKDYLNSHKGLFKQ